LLTAKKQIKSAAIHGQNAANAMQVRLIANPNGQYNLDFAAQK